MKNILLCMVLSMAPMTAVWAVWEEPATFTEDGIRMADCRDGGCGLGPEEPSKMGGFF